jgi:hypothetical protein
MTTAQKECPIPADAELEFAQNTKTGTVHILQYSPPPCLDHSPVTMPFAAGLEAMANHRTTMLCGRRLWLEPWGKAGDRVDVFDDDDLCIGCVTAMGDQSARAFEHRQPGDPDPEDTP